MTEQEHQREARQLERATWRTIDSCPEKESVLFFCGEFMQVGMMEHNVMRVGGDKRDCFWGWFGADESPPTHWMPLPETPNYVVGRAPK